MLLFLALWYICSPEEYPQRRPLQCMVGTSSQYALRAEIFLENIQTICSAASYIMMIISMIWYESLCIIISIFFLIKKGHQSSTSQSSSGLILWLCEFARRCDDEGSIYCAKSDVKPSGHKPVISHHQLNGYNFENMSRLRLLDTTNWLPFVIALRITFLILIICQ